MMKEKMFGNVKEFDNELREKVRMLETDIPRELEDRIMEEIDGLAIFPGISDASASQRSGRKTRVYTGTLAAAASIFLAVLLAVTLLFRSSPVPVDVEQEVSIDFAEVEGQPANTYIVNEQDPDITIIWFEKAPLIGMNTKLNIRKNSSKI